MVKVLVSGYYGFNNAGDEAILQGLIDGLKKTIKGIEITVLSKYPEFTSEKYNVKSANRNNIFEIIREIKKADLVISGGGSLLQDVTSKKSILYYLAILQIAMFFKKKTFIYSQGIGPINMKLNRWLTKKVLNHVDFINVRESQSKKYLEELGVKKDILVTTDTVFGIHSPSLEMGREILEELKVNRNKKLIGITIMDWKTYGNRTLEQMVSMLDTLLEKDLQVVLIPLYYYQDLNISKHIYEEVKKRHNNIFLLEKYYHVMEYLSVVGNMDIMVSMRLHGLIFSVLMGVYPIGISYDPKVDGLMKELERQEPLKVENFLGEDLLQEIEDGLNNLLWHKEKTNEKLNHFCNKAELHNEALKKMME